MSTTTTEARRVDKAHDAAFAVEDPWLAFCSLCDWRVTVNGEREAEARHNIHALTHQGRRR